MTLLGVGRRRYGYQGWGDWPYAYVYHPQPGGPGEGDFHIKVTGMIAVPFRG